MKAYLFCHSPILDPEQARQVLNRTAAVSTWISPFPYSAILVSSLEPNEIAGVLMSHFPGVWFLVTEVNQYITNGFLPKPFWDYVNNPTSANIAQILSQLRANAPPPALPTQPPQLGLAAVLDEIIKNQKKP